jgi:transposase
MEWTVAIGVDTHKEVHVAVALDGLGAQLDSREIATTPAGYRSLLSWAQELGVPVFAVEGTGSYGAGLVRFLQRAGVSCTSASARAAPSDDVGRAISSTPLWPRGGCSAASA